MVRPSDLYFKPTDVSFDECLSKWSATKQALEDVGFEIIEYDSSQSHAPRNPYSRDKYLLIEDKIFLPDINAYPYRPDVGTLNAIKNDSAFYHGILGTDQREVRILDDVWFETGNLILDEKEKTMFFGIHTMDHFASFTKLQQGLSPCLSEDWTYKPLTMAPGITRDSDNPNSHWFYHLDLALSERINGNTVMYCREAFTYASNRQLERHFNDCLSPVNVQEAQAGAINCVTHDNMMVSTSRLSHQLKQALSNRDIIAVNPQDYGVDDFMVVNGGVHCLTNTF